MNSTVTGRHNSGLLPTVVQGLREKVLSGHYAPGTRLPTEPQLQAEWGVSRSVVREAMKILASEGLVRVEQGRGSFVKEAGTGPLRQQLQFALARHAPGTGNSLDQWDALLDVRRELEMGAVSRASAHATPAEVAALLATVDSMRSHPGDAVACAADDYEFHLLLARSTRNPLWPVLLGSLHDLLQQFLVLSHHGVANALHTAGEHEAIARAIEGRDGVAAARAMQIHLESIERDLTAARKKRRLPPRTRKA